MEYKKFTGSNPRGGNKRPGFLPPFEEPENVGEGVVEGKNAVFAVLDSGRDIDKIFFASGSASSVSHIIAKARGLGVAVVECDRRKLDKMSVTGAHQGVIALCAAASYQSIDDMLALAASREEKPLIILCDGISDPHNLGAIIRSAEIAGAHGVIIPRRRSAGLNAACAKAAAGALEYLPVAKCANIPGALRELREKGLFLFAADMSGKNMYQTDFNLPCALVIGSEGNGVSRLVGESCDQAVSIPQKGKIPSLNASNAAAVLLYEVFRQRMK